MPTPYEVIQEYEGKEQIVVWFGEKASYEDKVVWRSVRKVWFLSETEETPMLEIKTAEDLTLYESALRQQGWIPDEKYNLGTISRVTFWKKADYAG